MFIESVLESEVEQIADARSQRVQSRQAYRWGVEQGSCLIDGQRVPIARPVRQRGGKELPLGTYQLFQRVSPGGRNRVEQHYARTEHARLQTGAAAIHGCLGVGEEHR